MFLLKDLVNKSSAKGNEKQMTQLRYQNIYFNDTYLLFPESLAKLPLTKQEREIKKNGSLLIDSEGGVANFSRPQLIEYCANDCFILLRLLGEFFTKQGTKIIGKVSMGSTAMYLFKKKSAQQIDKLPNLAKP
jgi:hypothetical protein